MYQSPFGNLLVGPIRSVGLPLTQLLLGSSLTVYYMSRLCTGHNDLIWADANDRAIFLVQIQIYPRSLKRALTGDEPEW